MDTLFNIVTLFNMVTLFNIAYSMVVLEMFGAALYLTWNYMKEMVKDYNND